MGGFAWVTLATNDSYSLGALVLAHSLRQVGTAHQLAVLVTPGVTNPMRQKLTTVFNVVQEVNILDSKDEINLRLLKRPELGITFTKLHCWRLTQFEKCVFLDADTLVLVNSDELFEREEFSAAPDVGWPDCFNSGVFVYRPSDVTYRKLVEFAVEKGSFDGGDQGLLNLFFSDWAHKDISKHLPFIYNMCSTASYSYLPAFKQFGADVKIVHFIGPAKPWLQYFDTESRKVQPSAGLQHLQDVLQRWWDIFCSLIHPNLTPDMSGLAGAFAQFTLGVKRSSSQDALENHLRRQGWEVGNIDYMGRDSFDNIWSKICETLAAAPPQPPQQTKSREPTPSSETIQEKPTASVTEIKTDTEEFEKTESIVTPVSESDQSKSTEQPKPDISPEAVTTTQPKVDETAVAPAETPLIVPKQEAPQQEQFPKIAPPEDTKQEVSQLEALQPLQSDELQAALQPQEPQVSVLEAQQVAPKTEEPLVSSEVKTDTLLPKPEEKQQEVQQITPKSEESQIVSSEQTVQEEAVKSEVQQEAKKTEQVVEVPEVPTTDIPQETSKIEAELKLEETPPEISKSETDVSKQQEPPKSEAQPDTSVQEPAQLQIPEPVIEQVLKVHSEIKTEEVQTTVAPQETAPKSDGSEEPPKSAQQEIAKPDVTEEPSTKTQEPSKPEVQQEITKPDVTEDVSTKPEPAIKPEAPQEPSSKPGESPETSIKPEVPPESSAKPEPLQESTKTEALQELSTKPEALQEPLTNPEVQQEPSTIPEVLQEPPKLDAQKEVSKPDVLQQVSQKVPNVEEVSKPADTVEPQKSETVPESQKVEAAPQESKPKEIKEAATETPKEVVAETSSEVKKEEAVPAEKPKKKKVIKVAKKVPKTDTAQESPESPKPQSSAPKSPTAETETAGVAEESSEATPTPPPRKTTVSKKVKPKK